MKYRRLVACVAFSFLFASSPSQAVTLDFAAFIDNVNGEEASEDAKIVQGVGLTAFGYSGGTAPISAPISGVGSLDASPSAYYDFGGAGIGVCRDFGSGTCNPSSDDNVTGFNNGTENEVLGILFDASIGAVRITELTFKDANHTTDQFGVGDRIDYSVNSGANWFHFLLPASGIVGLAANNIIGIGEQLLLAHNNQQFYLNTATFLNRPGGGIPPIPLPAALPLFGTGLGILGFMGWRRRRNQAA